MLTGTKALHALDRSQKIIEIAEDIAMMNADTGDPRDTAALTRIIENLEDTASRLRELTRAA
jgi:hypothetical protein